MTIPDEIVIDDDGEDEAKAAMKSVSKSPKPKKQKVSRYILKDGKLLQEDGTPAPTGKIAVKDLRKLLAIQRKQSTPGLATASDKAGKMADEVAEKESGSYLIRPSYDIAPFHAYCNFNENPGMNHEKLQKNNVFLQANDT